VDVVALTVEQRQLRVALYRRDILPDRGRAALPGGFVKLNESLDDAAARVLAHKAKIWHLFLEQLYTFGELKRDPRGRVISVAYYALVEPERFHTRAPGLLSARVRVPWQGETGGGVDVLDDDGKPMTLAFDHADIIGMAVKRLRGKLDYSPVGFQLLPEAFTLRQLQEVHETIRNEALNKNSFRRRMLMSGRLEATGAHEDAVAYRPAELYRFTRRSAV